MGYSSGLPLGWEAQVEIENSLVLQKRVKRFEKKNGRSPTMEEIEIEGKAYISEYNYKANLELLAQGTGIVGKEYDFEMFMSALSQTPAMEEGVRKKLIEMFSISHNTTLGHKAIAHLFKYRIFECIINFNFDEQLDKALGDSLREQEYQNIISDGDVDFEGEKSLHIKPHGTVNHPASMRFRKHDYTLTPPSILELIDNQFKGKVILILLGFAMESIEINELIHRKIKKVIIRATKKEIPEISDYDIEQRIKKMEQAIEGNLIKTEKSRKIFLKKFPELENLEFKENDLDLEIYTIDVVKKETTNIPSFNILNAINPRIHHLYSEDSLQKYANPGEDVLEKIIGEMVKLTKKEEIHPFREINVSKITSTLFQGLKKEAEILYRANKMPGRKSSGILLKVFEEMESKTEKIDFERNPNNLDTPEFLIAIHYLQIVMEIIFASAREKGFVDLDAVAQEKVGRHYQFYLQTCRKINLKRPKYKNIMPESLFEICKKLGLKNPTYSAKHFMIPEKIKSAQDLKEEQKITTKDLRKKKKEDMKIWIFENLERIIKELQEKSEIENMQESSAVFKIFYEKLFEGKNELDKNGLLIKNKDFLKTQSLLTKALETLFKGINKDIYHPSESRAISFFPEEIPHEVEKIKTWSRTDELSLENIKKNNWNEFWMLSQSGAWFFKDEVWQAVKSRVLNQKRNQQITIRIIATKYTPLEENALDQYRKILEEELNSKKITESEKQKLQNNLKVIYEQIPYWEHHHMLSACVKRERSGKYKIQHAIYGSRDGNKDFISPISLSRANEGIPGKKISKKTEEYLTYLEYLFKIHFLTSKRKKFDETKNKNAKSRPSVDYFLDPCGCEGRVQMRIDEEWAWAIEQI